MTSSLHPVNEPEGIAVAYRLTLSKPILFVQDLVSDLDNLIGGPLL